MDPEQLIDTQGSDMVRDVARRLEEDIRRRGLEPGDRYVPAKEVSAMLGVSESTAHRAMSILDEDHVLIRKRGRGTYVGPGIRREAAPRTRCIHIMMPRLNQRLGLSMDDMMRGIHHALPDVATQVNLFPRSEPLPVFERVLAEGRASGTLLGMGLILAPAEIQELVVARKVPAVVLGTPYAGVDSVASLDLDYRQMARVISGYLSQNGHRRVAMVCRDTLMPGDFDFLDALVQLFCGAGAENRSGLRVVSSPFNAAGVRAAVRRLFESEHPPTALLGLAGELFCSMIAEAAAEVGFVLGRDFELVSGLGAVFPRGPHCPMMPAVEPSETGERFGRMLAAMAEGRVPEPLHERIPVLLDPDYLPALPPEGEPLWKSRAED